MVRVTLRSAQMSDGSTIEIPDSGVVIIVGPNNAGKSQFLRDIIGLSRDPANYQKKTLTGIKMGLENTEGIERWVSENVPKIERDGTLRVLVDGWGEVGPNDVVSSWSQVSSQGHLAHLTSLFILHADGNSRLTSANPQSNIDFATQLPTNPIQAAYIDPDIEAQLSEQTQAAFGQKVSVERWAGAQLFLRIGDPPEFGGHPTGVPSREFLNARNMLPALHEQGDGVRSYAGLLLNLLAGRHQIYLVDEPEAFLHPPQSRRLGRVLADQTVQKQAIIATHSSSILQGALESEQRTTIIRITRRGDINHAAVISHSALNTLWSDPLLRYSNLFDGLFHDAVILCEGDSDCKYYSAVLDQHDDETHRAPQLLFSHCGGKSRMPNVVTALRAAKVPVVVTPDIDLLRDKDVLMKLIGAMGGDFSVIEPRWNVLRSAVADTNRLPLTSEVRANVNQYFENEAGDRLTSADQRKLNSMLKAESGWTALKRSGASAIPQGDATAAFNDINAYLKDIGILVVPCGELERFEPDIPDHGPKWVSQVFEANRHLSPSQASRDYTKLIRDTAALLAQTN